MKTLNLHPLISYFSISKRRASIKFWFNLKILSCCIKYFSNMAFQKYYKILQT